MSNEPNQNGAGLEQQVKDKSRLELMRVLCPKIMRFRGKMHFFPLEICGVSSKMADLPATAC